jgi:hypothetical protein
MVKVNVTLHADAQNMLESYQQLDPNDRVNAAHSADYEVVNAPAADKLQQQRIYENWPLPRDKDLKTLTNLSRADNPDL